MNEKDNFIGRGIYDAISRAIEVRVDGVRVLTRVEERADRGRCEQGHDDCLGPKVAANDGGCRMDTWGDVG